MTEQEIREEGAYREVWFREIVEPGRVDPMLSVCWDEWAAEQLHLDCG